MAVGVKMKRGLCIGDQHGIKQANCPECGNPMVREDGGYSESFNGEYDQVEHTGCWHCEKCGHVENE